MVSERELPKLLKIGIVLFTISVGIVSGLPYGPLPPDAETGFSLQSFKDFVLGGFPSDRHTHDPSEMYMHKGQEPSVAEVAIAGSHDQKPVAGEAGEEADGDQTIGHPIAGQARVLDNDEEAVAEGHPMEEEQLEELDVPHEHPEMQYKGMMEDGRQAAGKDITFKEEI